MAAFAPRFLPPPLLPLPLLLPLPVPVEDVPLVLTRLLLGGEDDDDDDDDDDDEEEYEDVDAICKIVVVSVVLMEG